MLRNPIKVYARLKKEDCKKKKGVGLGARDKIFSKDFILQLYQIIEKGDHDDLILCYDCLSTKEKKKQKYRFHKVFDGGSTQEEVFETIAKPIVDRVLDGFNGTVLAYGQVT